MKTHYTAFHGFILGALLLLAPAQARAQIPADENAAVIFAYQRIGEDSVPASNLSLEQFEAHVLELKGGGYTVLPLGEIVERLRSGDNPLPPKTVALTFDGAWLPTIHNAVPLLEKAGLPYTVFFAADLTEAGIPNYMSRDQLKTLAKSKLATLGILPASYVHMVDNDADTNAALINRAVARYRDLLGRPPAFFVWPFGEYSAALQRQAGEYGFTAAFGQQSGVAHARSDFLALPRFIMTDDYGDIDRFRLTASALPLPVTDIVPEDPLIGNNPPIIGFTLPAELEDASRLSCFVSDVGKTELARLGQRVEIRLDAPLQDRKTRVNCTLRNGDSWRWLGLILVAPLVEEDNTAMPLEE